MGFELVFLLFSIIPHLIFIAFNPAGMKDSGGNFWTRTSFPGDRYDQQQVRRGTDVALGLAGLLRLVTGKSVLQLGVLGLQSDTPGNPFADGAHTTFVACCGT